VYDWVMRVRLAIALVTLVAGAAAADPVGDARATLDAWLAAQNGGRYADYEALYAPAFHGVRRSGPKIIELNRDGWLRDRQRMFKKPMKVAIDKLAIEARADGVHLTFQQTFESGSFGDVGEKELVVAPADGRMKVVREEMRSSTRLPKALGAVVCDTMACKKASPEVRAAIVATCTRACEAGDADGCRDRGLIFSQPICDVEKDLVQASAAFEKACDLEDSMACDFAARFYERLDPTVAPERQPKVDPSRAAALFEKACVQSEVIGCYELAMMLRDGKGVKPDAKRALELLDRQCRDNGRAPGGSGSCSELEEMYKTGTHGVKKDRTRAREYHALYVEATSGE
jgi:hypothetical protein